jgi:hypothetical protein
MGRKVYFPFAIVTIIQFIGNVFFTYTYININSKEFIDWVDLVSPLTELLGVEPTDLVGNKRFLAFFAGGMLPIISLSFLHMLVKFTEEDRKKEQDLPQTPDQLKEFVDETTRIRLSESDLKILEDALLNPSEPNENLVNAAEKYKDNFTLSDEDILKRAESIQLKKTFERMEKIESMREELHGSILTEDEPEGALSNSELREKNEKRLQEILEEIEEEERIKKEKQDILDNTIDLFNDQNEKVMTDFVDNVVRNNSELENGKWIDEEKLKQRELLSEIIKNDEELGLYDEPFDNPLVKEPSDDEVSDWDVTLMDGLEDEEPFFTEEEIENILQEEPTEEEIQQNFSTIEPETENIFQDNQFITPVDEPEIIFSDEFITEAIQEFNQEEINESIPETITLPFEPIPLPIDLIIQEVIPDTENIIEQPTLGQTEDLTDEKKN